MWFSRSTASRSVKGICVKQWNEKENQNHGKPNRWISFYGVIWNVFPATRMSIALQCLPPLHFGFQISGSGSSSAPLRASSLLLYLLFLSTLPTITSLDLQLLLHPAVTAEHQSGDQKDKKISSVPGPEFHGHIPTQPSLELWNSWSSLPLLPSEDDSKKLGETGGTNSFRDLELCCIWNEDEIQVHSSLYKTVGAKYVLEFRILSNFRKVN